jgi:hypothetical protein
LGVDGPHCPALNSMADVLKYTREDLKTLVYHPIRPLDVVSEEIGIPVDQVLSPLL